MAFRRESDKPSVGKTTTGGPVKLEGTIRVGNKSSVELQGFAGGICALKVDEAVSGIATEVINVSLHTEGQCGGLKAYPENLSRIIFTFTW